MKKLDQYHQRIFERGTTISPAGVLPPVEVPLLSYKEENGVVYVFHGDSFYEAMDSATFSRLVGADNDES